MRYAAMKIVQKEGGRAFYFGMSCPLIGSALSEALQFTVLRKMKLALMHFEGTNDLSYSSLMFASVLTGLCNTVILCPIELVKM